MSTLTFKISAPTPSGPPQLRKLTLPHSPTSPLHFAHLSHAIRQRFGLAEEGDVELCYLDEEGDWIVLSCEEELQELLQSLDGNTRTVRLQLTTPASQRAPVSPAETPQQSSGGEREYTSADEWLDVGTPGDTSLQNSQADEHTPVGTPTLLFDLEDPFDFEDPAEAPLNTNAETSSLADKPRAMIESEFPRPSSTPPVAEDPADEPIPAAASEDAPPAFTTLPSSLSGLLSGLPSHATSLSSHLSTLLTSPDSALGRLSSLLQNPTSEFPSPSFDLRDLSASLAAVGQDVTRAIGEVVEGVRMEADGVRHEFDELRGEFEREKRRFEEEIRRAMEQARAAQGVPASTSTATLTDPAPAADAAADADADLESSAARAARRAIRQAKKQHKAARRLEKAQRKLERRAKKEREAELLARAQDDLLKASRESMGQEREGQEGVEMSCMPGGMPASFAVPAASVQQPFVAESTSTPAYNPAYPASPASSSSSTSSTSTSSSASDDDKPILLTKFLLAAAELGFDVSEHATRIALTDVWCESNGRGLSRMVERACDELL
ncbi:hypothetical protein JCM10049v2_003022 [Rhodotorula toruloides]